MSSHNLILGTSGGVPPDHTGMRTEERRTSRKSPNISTMYVYGSLCEFTELIHLAVWGLARFSTPVYGLPSIVSDFRGAQKEGLSFTKVKSPDIVAKSYFDSNVISNL